LDGDGSCVVSSEHTRITVACRRRRRLSNRLRIRELQHVDRHAIRGLTVRYWETETGKEEVKRDG